MPGSCLAKHTSLLVENSRNLGTTFQPIPVKSANHLNRYVILTFPYANLVTYDLLERRMSHMKWRKTKQHPSLQPDQALLCCCLVSFHFKCDILRSSKVFQSHYQVQYLQSTSIAPPWAAFLPDVTHGDAVGWLRLPHRRPIQIEVFIADPENVRRLAFYSVFQ